MSRISSSRGFLIVALAAALLAGGLLVFLYVESSSARGAVAAMKDEIARAQRKEALGATLRTALMETAPERAELGTHFIQKNGDVSFIEGVEELARIARVTVSIQSVAVSEGNGALPALRMDLRAAGGWASVVHFLALADALPVVHAISSMSLDGKEGNLAAPWVLSMSLTAYKRASP